MKSTALLFCVGALLPVACSGPSVSSEPAGSSPGAAAPNAPGRSQDGGLTVPAETYTLPNGLAVTLHEDHSLPKVVVDTWFAVGSKDEEPGRTGFAHLFEHLMFMGTHRVPDNQFDVLMERGGGNNNASTSTDRTNYYSLGPSSLLPTLLWLDADRLDSLADAMTAEKVDKQRAVVRNERRQTSENVPYGKEGLLLPPVLYPAGHPYHHPIIGSHEDLEAATLEDVQAFFHRFYVPANASLVVAGDFDPAVVKPLIARTFGAVPAQPAPPRLTAPPFGSPEAVHLDREQRIVATDKVQFPKLTLVWHSPAYYAPGDAEMDLIGAILADGSSSRLEQRLVTETGLAQSVYAYQGSRELGSEFQIGAIAAPGADLEAIRGVITDELERFQRDGPTAAELARVKAQQESNFLRRMEGLFSRADALNAYRHFFGVADGFQRDLDRWLTADATDLTSWSRRVFARPLVDLRILPEGASVPAASLDERPADLATPVFLPPAPTSFQLSNGIPVHLVERPGKRLFAGSLIARGGEALFPAAQAGLGDLTARLLESGAGGLDQAAFAAATESLGASLGASVDTRATRIDVDGLTSHLDETLDRFRDLALAPNLEQADFDRERSLQEAAIEARADNPVAVARLVARALLFGRDDPRGRPGSGELASVRALTLADVRAARERLLSPANATFVFVGDFGPEGSERLRSALEARFGAWRAPATVALPVLAARTEAGPGGLYLVDRPGAPQTVLILTRPAATLDGAERQARACANTVLGGSFTSRLNQNLREDKGYTYGAGSRISEEGEQTLFTASSSVRTDVTGAALVEFRREFDQLHAAGLSADELQKATSTLQRGLVESGETTAGLAATLARLVQNGRPPGDLRASLAALGEVTPALTERSTASDLFRFDQLVIVLVGDRERVLPQLREAGFPEPVALTVDAELVE